MTLLTDARASRARALLSALATVAVATLLAVPALAGPFNNGDLFVGRTIKPSSSDRLFATGARFQIAPVKALVQSQVKKAVDAQVSANPESAAVIEYLKEVDTAQLRALADSGNLDAFKAAFKKQLAAQGKTMSPAQEQAINAIDAKKLKVLADVIEIYNEPKETLTFALEPYLTLNLSPVQITAQVAIAGFDNDDGASLELGNVGLDLNTGDAYGLSGAAFGWTLGVNVWAPTGTADADTIALSNVMASPRYLHNYMTLSPYAVIGGDLAIFDLTARAEYVDMRPVRGPAGLKRSSYVNVGGGLLADLGFVGVSLELDGLLEVDNAAAMDNVWLATAGLRSYLGPLQLGAGVQVPLVQDADSFASVGGANLGSPSDYNILLNGQFKF